MPRVRKRVTNRGVPLNILEGASDVIRDEGRTVRAVAKDFAICHTTLFRFNKRRERLTGEGSDKLPRAGYWTSRKVFSEDQERSIREYLKRAADLYYGLNPKRVHFKPHFIRDGPPGCIGTANASGWMQEADFLVYLKHFQFHTKSSSESKVLLNLDTPRTCLWKASTSAAAKALSFYPPTNGQAGCTGIWPFNREIFQECEFAPSLVTDRPLPPSAVPPPTGPPPLTGPPSFCACPLRPSSSEMGTEDFSPEAIRSHPKAGAIKKCAKGRKRCSIAILTDTHLLEIQGSMAAVLDVQVLGT
ncbi:unnamed protein product [Leuciscus chuanchicus]